MPTSKRYRVVGDTPTIDAAAKADDVELATNYTSRTEPRLQPYWTSECGRAVVYVGDCRDVMAQMEPQQFHAVVTDPPYNLIQGGFHLRSMKQNGDGTDRTQQDNYKTGGFMGQKWDGTGVPFQPSMWEKVLGLARPRAHLLSFGGTRTWHRMACAVEDAGWEIRDTIMWVYGSGFPKSVDVSKAIDKHLGAERSKVRKQPRADTNGTFCGSMDTRPWIDKSREVGYHEVDGNEPATDAARQWRGFGTALKPAVEPIILARKSLPGTVAQCVMEHGTGALNIDATRVGTEEMKATRSDGTFLSNNTSMSGHNTGRINAGVKTGRWPANFIHNGSEEVLALFPQSKSSSQEMPLPLTPGDSNGADHGNNGRSTVRGHDDSGSAARYFYTAKADADDRPHGKGATAHPTVKPLDLMRYLVRLVCAPGGVLLDPFCGSGSTGCAAILEGMRFVGIEQSKEYADLAVGRLKLALAERPDAPTAPGRPARQEASSPPTTTKLRGME